MFTVFVESIGILVYLDCLISDKAKKDTAEIMLLTLDVNQDQLVHVIAHPDMLLYRRLTEFGLFGRLRLIVSVH